MSKVEDTRIAEEEISEVSEKKVYKAEDLICQVITEYKEDGNNVYCEEPSTKSTEEGLALATCEKHLDVELKRDPFSDIQLEVEALAMYEKHIKYLEEHNVKYYIGETGKSLFENRRRQHKSETKKIEGNKDGCNYMQVLFVAKDEIEGKKMEKLMIEQCWKNKNCMNGKASKEKGGHHIVYVLTDINGIEKPRCNKKSSSVSNLTNLNLNDSDEIIEE